MRVDAKIRRVTRPERELFLELGFAAHEAEEMRVALHKEIDDARRRGEPPIRREAGGLGEGGVVRSGD